MRFVITAERALSEGTSPDQIEMIAEWHDSVVGDIRSDLKLNKKKVRHGGKASIARHEMIAQELRIVATEMRDALRKAA